MFTYCPSSWFLCVEPGYSPTSFYFTLKDSLPLVFCLLVTSFLHLNLSGNISIYLSFLKDTFCEYRISGVQSSSVGSLSMSSIASWPPWFLKRNWLLIFVEDSLSVTSCFSAFLISSSSLSFDSLIMCLSMESR